MRDFLKWLLIVLAGVGLLVVVIVWVYAPLRTRSLAAKYTRFPGGVPA